MITEEEAMRLIEAAQKPRDKAMVAFLFDSGARVGELMNLRIKDVIFNGEVTHVVLNGKTGMRRIPILNSNVYLSRWIAQHPSGGKPESKVFCSIFKGAEKALTYGNISQGTDGLLQDNRTEG